MEFASSHIYAYDESDEEDLGDLGWAVNIKFIVMSTEYKM